MSAAEIAALRSALQQRGLDPSCASGPHLLEGLKALGVEKLGARLKIMAALQQGAAAPTTPQPAITGFLDDLSEAQCVALLKELIDAYQEPGFAAELEAFQRQHGVMYVMKLGPLVLKVQAPILARHGLAPDPSGVEAMKMAVQRRIAEGSPEAQRRLELLANEARRCLGIAPMPDTRSRGSVEEVLAQMVISDRADGMTRPADADSPSQVQAAISRSRGSGSVSGASAAYLEGDRRAVQTLVPFLATVLG